VDAIILIGDQLKKPRDKALAEVRQLLGASRQIVILGEQAGHGLHNKNGEGIEHFGYVDGRSQPIFLSEDLADERLRADGTANWDPGFGPGRAIVPDPAAPNPATQFGSYFVFRKLEQNVRLFKKEEKKLASRLKLRGEDEERAGAMLVGRFEDGTPVTAQFGAGAHNPVQNNFNYDSDSEGGKCPFFAHIRKVNPRGTGGFEPVSQERLHIMARRGQTYGVRTDDPNDGRIANKPVEDVGLLFMAFNVDLAAQFEFAQKTWANNPGFPRVPAGSTAPGLDPVIGQGARGDIACPLVWGADLTQPAQHKLTNPVPRAVTMKGGEYCFMPSLAFLAAL
jgi:deferrochelatase/peroxidase EfeB